ncbi:hypothetical protein GGI02_005917 [Coemansia sp. RSA 2322]|uniref:Uncharacterized protein n=1 Tax=Coemansia thaxteri TaxID=2663907 RepID=A0A9W8EG68_9FUNG|nr:hypothetical protein H4R26_002197 [Coemansia thaxteri]KAJ2459146.1 hypothetical protein GGI02_005917 [Coemansia sp. RSA 2322]KAJ2476768.1 hypothetical protein EV174_004822 [Coemansia sp. RSA 2320]
MAVVGRPLGLVPPALSNTYTPESDVKLVTTSAALVRDLVEARRRQREQDYVLAQISAATANEGGLPADAARKIDEILTIYPDIASQVPTDAEHLGIYAASCWQLVLAIVGLATSAEEADRVVGASIVSPMSIIQHNNVAGLLFHNIGTISTTTLFKYLDAVEASCRQYQEATTSAQVQHHVKYAAMVLEKALLADHNIAEEMAVELSSFCLSYPWVKKATDLFQMMTKMRMESR